MPHEHALPVAARFAAYSLAVCLSVSSLTFLSRHDGIDVTSVFRENGPIEWTQFGLLVIAAALLVVGALVNAEFRETFLLLAAVTAFAAVRELDGLLDALIPWIGWKVGFVFALLAALQVRARRIELASQASRFVCSSSFVVLWAGFIVAVPVAQMLGHGAFLESMMGDHYDRSYKRVIEESGELVGYVLLVAGSVEATLNLRARRVPLLARSRRLLEPDPGVSPDAPRG
jgi:hypothetical protein